MATPTLAYVHDSRRNNWVDRSGHLPSFGGQTNVYFEVLVCRKNAPCSFDSFTWIFFESGKQIAARHTLDHTHHYGAATNNTAF